MIVRFKMDYAVVIIMAVSGGYFEILKACIDSKSKEPMGDKA